MKVLQTEKNKIVNFKNFYDLLASLLLFGVVILKSQSLEDLRVYLIYSSIFSFLVLLVDFFVLRQRKRGLNGLWLTLLFLVGYFGFQASLSSVVVRWLVAALSALVFYVYKSYFPRKMPGSLLEVINVMTAIYLLVFLLGLNFFFGLQWWHMVGVVFVCFTLLFWQAFYKMGVESDDRILFAVLSSIVLTQATWAVLYLPVNFLTSALIVFTPFYLIFMFSHIYFQGRLERDKLFFHAGLIAVVLLLSMLSSPWTP